MLATASLLLYLVSLFCMTWIKDTCCSAPGSTGTLFLDDFRLPRGMYVGSTAKSADVTVKANVIYGAIHLCGNFSCP